MSSTSGRARVSHQVTFSRRAFNEFTFQVAIRTDLGYQTGPAPTPSPRPWPEPSDLSWELC
jgi:hypothetical protein